MSTSQADVPKILNPADGVWVRQEIDNLTWIDLGDRLVAIDALEKPETKDDAFAAIRKTGGEKPVAILFNTHTHYDHVALNDDFRREWGAEVVNLDNTDVPDEGAWYEGPERRVLFRPMPGCHTSTDAIVWAPDPKVLCVGDLFGWGIVPLTRNVRRDSLDQLLGYYRELIGYDADVMVPGHGPLGDTDTLKRFVEYLNWLVDETTRRVAEGQSDDEIEAALAPPEDMQDWWRFTEWKHADSRGKVLKSARKGWL
jgi:glyoxylase-like metal-dependent hydrolase (beta-lactamase superfamily II)